MCPLIILILLFTIPANAMELPDIELQVALENSHTESTQTESKRSTEALNARQQQEERNKKAFEALRIARFATYTSEQQDALFAMNRVIGKTVEVSELQTSIQDGLAQGLHPDDILAPRGALSYAAETCGDLNSFRFLETLVNAGTMVKNRPGKEPLAYTRSARATRFLLQHGADVNYRDENGGLLHYCVVIAKNEYLPLLYCQYDIDPTLVDTQGLTPLAKYAAITKKPDKDMVAHLVAIGVPLDTKAQSGKWKGMNLKDILTHFKQDLGRYSCYSYLNISAEDTRAGNWEGYNIRQRLDRFSSGIRNALQDAYAILDIEDAITSTQEEIEIAQQQRKTFLPALLSTFLPADNKGIKISSIVLEFDATSHVVPYFVYEKLNKLYSRQEQEERDAENAQKGVIIAVSKPATPAQAKQQQPTSCSCTIL